jgi:hypothetical protein
VNTPVTDADEDFAPPPPRRRFWRLRKFALWVVGIVAAVILLSFVGRWQVGRLGQRQLDATNARLDADDSGWRLDDIFEARKKAEPPGEENAARAVLDLAERIPEDWGKWRNSEQAVGFPPPQTGNYLPSQEAIDAARKHAADTLLVRTEALRLRDKKGGQFTLTVAPDPIATLLPHLDKCRSLAALLQYDAHLAVIDKNPNRGVSAARAALAVARAIGDEPLLVSQLVRIACATMAANTAMQVLAWGEPTEGLAELQAELLAEADYPHFRTGLRGERAMLDKVFRGLEDGSIPPEHWFTYAGIKNPGPEHYAAFRTYRALLPGDHAKALAILTAYLDATKLPHHEQLGAIQAVPIPKGPPEEFRYIVTRLLVPACEKVDEAGLRCRANLLVAATCVACERFRLKHGRLPRELAELTPEFLPAVPLSPFDGRPISFRPHADRIVVDCHWPMNSVRADSLPEDFRVEGRPGAGIGYRVWIPARRGLPPEKREEKKDP